jgi:hypothetical protein
MTAVLVRRVGEMTPNWQRVGMLTPIESQSRTSCCRYRLKIPHFAPFVSGVAAACDWPATCSLVTEDAGNL